VWGAGIRSLIASRSIGERRTKEWAIMFWIGLMWGVAAAVLIAAVIVVARWAIGRSREKQMANQRAQFSRRREWLEAKFLQTAGNRGTPRGLEWVDCDFADEISFARDRRTGELTALVAVAIRFRAIEGGGMEDVEAVANQKAATAVFRHRGDEWTTDGRAIFNLNPVEAIEFYHSELERVE
jgi:hypothetical protein